MTENQGDGKMSGQEIAAEAAFKAAVSELRQVVAQSPLPSHEIREPLALVCQSCVVSDRDGICCFAIIKPGAPNRARIPKDCPRELSRWVHPHHIEKRGNSVKFFELAVMGELENNGGRAKIGYFHDLFPYLPKRTVLRVLNNLKRQGKIALTMRREWKLVREEVLR